MIGVWNKLPDKVVLTRIVSQPFQEWSEQSIMPYQSTSTSTTMIMGRSGGNCVAKDIAS